MYNPFSTIKSPKIQAALNVILFWVIFIALLFASGIAANNLLPKTFERFSYGILGTLAALIATYILIKKNNKSFSEYELIWQKNTLVKFFLGLGIGVTIFALLILCLVFFSNLTVQKTATVWAASNYFWLLSIIPLALMEELAFRAFPFIQLNKAFGLRITQIIIAIAFALYHFIQGWDLQVAFLGPGLWSFVFVLAAFYYKGIAVATGIHVALNLMQQLFNISNTNKPSIWLVESSKVNVASGVSADTVGICFQIVVLIATVIIGEYLLRKRNTN